MNILKPVDIEEELRLALDEYMTVYCRPLPKDFTVPCVLIAATGGNTENTVDTFTVSVDARAKLPADAYGLLSNALGVLEASAQQQVGAIRNVTINSLARWGNDPVRPDLNLCTATVLVTAHRDPFDITKK